MKYEQIDSVGNNKHTSK